MSAENVKKQLIQATVRLLTDSGDPGKITARQIAAAAGTTIGMINYYFTSKDALLNTAINSLISERALELREIMRKEVPAKEKLTEFMIKMSDITVDYAQFTKPTIPYVLLEREFEEPYHILPMIKDYFGDKKSEEECRIIAYQLTSFFQVIFYRTEDFKKYAGIDVLDKKQRDQFLMSLIGLMGIK